METSPLTETTLHYDHCRQLFLAGWHVRLPPPSGWGTELGRADSHVSKTSEVGLCPHVGKRALGACARNLASLVNNIFKNTNFLFTCFYSFHPKDSPLYLLSLRKVPKGTLLWSFSKTNQNSKHRHV